MRKKISYAQYGEDIILATLLEYVNRGFYVDVGANYETNDSVTKYFYKNGWTGINIEPVLRLYRDLEQKRTRDINLNIGVSASGNPLTFNEHKVHGHSTFLDVSSSGGKKQDSYVSYRVQTRRLDDIFEQYVAQDIHFLKIDVEGFEEEVVTSNDWTRFRPHVVCIEANHVRHDWRPLLMGANYQLFIQDGLNEYYVAQEHWAKATSNYAERAVKNRALFMNRFTDNLIKQNARLRQTIDNEHQSIKALEARLTELGATSYSNKPLRKRVYLALCSIVVDWPRYKRGMR